MPREDESPSISTVDEGEASSWSKDHEMIRDQFKEEIKEKSVTIKNDEGENS